jgi:ERF superfamily
MTDIVQFPSGTPAPATLVGAIAAVMNEVHVVAKRGVNEFHRYRYAKMEDILQEITPLLGKHGLVIFQSETGRAMFDEDNVIAVEYSFTVAHVSGETWPQPLRQTGVSMCRNSKGGWDDKSLNKCHTAARKYFLLALFQIPTGEEADADRGENETTSRDVVSNSSIADRAIKARRAAVQLNRSFQKPAYVMEPPQRKLQREINKQRHAGSQYEAQIKAEQRDRHTGRFQQPMISGQYDERNPPPEVDGIPEFLDRRR